MRFLFMKIWLAPVILLASCSFMTFSSPNSDTFENKSSTLVSNSETLEGYLIGEIIIERVNVFNPKVKGEDRQLFRFINAIHTQTREIVIRRELLFKEGDPYIESVVKESARNLRKLSFLHTAIIEPVAIHDGVVDLKVYVQDAWTTKIGLNIGRKGGVNTFKIGLTDDNFLGLGKKMLVDQYQGIENSGTIYKYYDYQFLGTKWNLKSLYEDNTDGENIRVNVMHPFYSLNTRWAFYGEIFSNNRVKKLYHFGAPSAIFKEKQDLLKLTFGLSRGLKDGISKRYFFTYSYMNKRFSEADTLDAFPSLLPDDRKDSIIRFHFERLTDSYIKVRRFHKFDTIEDFHIGNKFTYGIGLALSPLGSTKDGIVFDIFNSQGFQVLNSELLFLDVGYHARLEKESLRNSLFSLSAQYFNKKFNNQTIFSKLSCDIGLNLDAEKRFLLGGENGLRGYPIRYLDGNRQLLFTLEDRIFTDIELFHLFNIGMALFFDTGIAWDRETEFTASSFRSNIGIGLRVGLRRSAFARVVHIDLAYPLNRIDGKRSLQLLVMTSETF